MCRFREFNPIDYHQLDQYILESNGYSFFHSREWIKTLQDTYGFYPKYVLAIDSNRLKAAVPLMEVKSTLTGNRAVSLPFSDYCTPLYKAESDLSDTLDYLIDYGRKRKWRSIEFRTEGIGFKRKMSSKSFLGHNLILDKNVEIILSGFRKDVRQNIKKAVKNAVKCKIDNSFDALKIFYRLHCQTKKKHGLPPQPFRFFKNLYQNVISNHSGHIVLAKYDDRAIAGAVFLHFGKTAVYKYSASLGALQYLRPNNLVLWTGIKWYAENGFKSLTMGRTEPGNTGLNEFKNGWRPRSYPIAYFKYDFLKKDFVRENNNYLHPAGHKIISLLPDFVLKPVASIFYKHMA